jgi:hypothetical protein
MGDIMGKKLSPSKGITRLSLLLLLRSPADAAHLCPAFSLMFIRCPVIILIMCDHPPVFSGAYQPVRIRRISPGSH